MSFSSFREKLNDLSEKAREKSSWDSKSAKIPGMSSKSTDQHVEVNARPLAALKDPRSFPPPPKHGAASAPVGQNAYSTQTPAQYQQQPQPGYPETQQPSAQFQQGQYQLPPPQPQQSSCQALPPSVQQQSYGQMPQLSQGQLQLPTPPPRQTYEHPQQPTQPVFGQPQQSAQVHGQPQQPLPPAYGQQQQPFQTGYVQQPPQSAYQQQPPQSAYGQPRQQTPQPTFGQSQQPAQSAFGQQLQPSYGRTPQPAQPAYGQPPQSDPQPQPTYDQPSELPQLPVNGRPLQQLRQPTYNQSQLPHPTYNQPHLPQRSYDQPAQQYSQPPPPPARETPTSPSVLAYQATPLVPTIVQQFPPGSPQAPASTEQTYFSQAPTSTPSQQEMYGHQLPKYESPAGDVQQQYAPMPAPPAREVPALPHRDSLSGPNTAEPATQPKAPLPDPMSFPPPPVFGRHDSSRGTSPRSGSIHAPVVSSSPAVSTDSGVPTTSPPPQPVSAQQEPTLRAALPDPHSFGPPPVYGRPVPASPAARSGTIALSQVAATTAPTPSTKPPKPGPKPGPKPVAKPSSKPTTPVSHPEAPPSYSSVEGKTPSPPVRQPASPEFESSGSVPSLAERMARLSTGTGAPNFAAQIASHRPSNASADSQAVTPQVPCATVSDTTERRGPPVPAKKKPSVPPKKHAGQQSGNSTVIGGVALPPSSSYVPHDDGPPPVPHHSKPSHSKPPVDLELYTGWFARPGPLELPSALRGRNYTYSTMISGNAKTVTIALRDPTDLSIARYTLQWSEADPINTVSITESVTPPPQTPSYNELLEAWQRFGDGVATWSEQKTGLQVGNGECWTLAAEAIKASSAEGAMSSQNLIHGALIYEQHGPYAPRLQLDEVRRGDVIQFLNAYFETKDGQGRVIRQMKSGNPDHTSVVTSAGVPLVHVVHQNLGGVKRVATGTYNFSELVSGQIRVFRVMPREWAGELTV